MVLLIIVTIALLILNLFVTRILFNDRLIGKILIGTQVIFFITIQSFFWKYVNEEFFYYNSNEGFAAFLILIIIYIAIIYFLAKRTVVNRIFKKFIKNYIPESKISNKDLLAKFNYIYYHKRYEKRTIKSKIIYSNIYDCREKDGYEEYMAVFYILEKTNKKNKLYIEKVIFKKKIFEHLDVCPNCGNSVKVDNVYCDYCSTKLVDEDNIYDIQSIDLVESLSMKDVVNRANKNNLFLHMFVANIIHTALILFICYLLELLELKGFSFMLTYFILMTVPILMMFFSVESPLFDDDESHNIIMFLSFSAVLISIFDYGFETVITARYFITIIIAAKALTYLYFYFKCRRRK